MFRNRTTLFLGILAAAVVSFGTTSTDTQEPDGQPGCASHCDHAALRTAFRSGASVS
jgi:hypothetical protein